MQISNDDILTHSLIITDITATNTFSSHTHKNTLTQRRGGIRTRGGWGRSLSPSVTAGLCSSRAWRRTFLGGAASPPRTSALLDTHREAPWSHTRGTWVLWLKYNVKGTLSHTMSPSDCLSCEELLRRTWEQSASPSCCLTSPWWM